MSQKNWDRYFYNICLTVSTNSKCLSRHIGAILVKDNSIISTGYNGPPRGIPHCGIRHQIDPHLLSQYKSIDKYFNENIEVKKCPRQILGYKSGEGLEWCCLSEDTRVHLFDGRTKEIQELYEKEREGWIFAIDPDTLEITFAKYTNIYMNGIRNDLVEIFFDNTLSLKVTPDHLIMMQDGSFRTASQLKPKDSIMALYSDYNKNILKTYYKIVKITHLNKKYKVYDLEVPHFHNYAVDLGDDTGVFVHNCAGHAERNTLINAARMGVCTKGTKMYMTCGIPCTPCLVEIINAGVEEIIITKIAYYDKSAKYILTNSNLSYRIFSHLTTNFQNNDDVY